MFQCDNEILLKLPVVSDVGNVCFKAPFHEIFVRMFEKFLNMT